MFFLSRTKTGSLWSAVSSEKASISMKIDISSPANAVIGRYRLSYQIYSMCSTTSHSLADIILLFNPWAPGDDVYMADAALRKEYVLNDFGILYAGNQHYIQGKPWNYGQFERNILKTSLAMLDRSINYSKDKAKDVSSRYDPVYVGRVCSAVINSNDEKGVLLGKWGEPYSDGVKPSDWNGSVAILRQWYNNNYQSVKYGQCWVFSGVMCTVLRCLGIPARSVTNFESAHDTDVNLTIDKYVDPSGVPLHQKDSIWNFHVWNEGWFVRKDLGSFYNGWQVLDATPQEPSEGSAKEREIYKKACNKLFRGSLEDSSVVSDEDLENDLADDFSEDSEEEPQGSQISAQFKLANSPLFGQDVNVMLVLKNATSDSKTIRINQKAFSVDYTGTAVKEILKVNTSVDLSSNDEKQISLKIPFDQYENSLTEDNIIQVVAVCEDEQGKKQLVQRSIVIESPPIIIKAPDQVTVKRTVQVEAVFENPLSEELKNCRLVVEGSGLVKDPLKIKVGDLKPKEKMTVPFKITPYTCGTQQLLVALICEKISEVKNYQSIAVVKA
uniref:Protein-glutamine gamma-glutamyltransferase E-like isoform X2 n=1 Tax=Geotrypetes seraphini TaxID=260995 RepID=A0A6P8SMS3_GEOSA|nr:protein-glutamine gamma-glutamyltransferase E-like isoform X2 [Geotrypetes seraphini]